MSPGEVYPRKSKEDAMTQEIKRLAKLEPKELRRILIDCEITLTEDGNELTLAGKEATANAIKERIRIDNDLAHHLALYGYDLNMLKDPEKAFYAFCDYEMERVLV